MASAQTNQTRRPRPDRRRDLEILGLLKPTTKEPSESERSLHGGNSRELEARPRPVPESLPHWI
jgi:hypothetical protein